MMQVKNKPLIFLLSVVVSFGSFVFGYSLVCISMLETPIQLYNRLGDSEIDYWLSILTTALPLGAILGTFLMKKVADSMGENKAMILCDALAVAACGIQLSDLSLRNLCIGRLLIGVYCGISSGIIPSYLMSLAP